MKKLIVLLSILTILPVYGITLTPIKEGDPAPHDGFVITKTEERVVRKIHQQNIKLKDLVVKKNQKIDIQSKRIVNLQKQLKRKTPSKWGKYIYIGLGVVATGLAVHLAGKIK